MSHINGYQRSGLDVMEALAGSKGKESREAVLVCLHLESGQKVRPDRVHRTNWLIVKGMDQGAGFSREHRGR